jgi:hypothetical protein
MRVAGPRVNDRPVNLAQATVVGQFVMLLTTLIEDSESARILNPQSQVNVTGIDPLLDRRTHHCHLRKTITYRMLRRNVFLAFLALTLSSCNLLRGKCTYEIRSLDAAGEVSENGAQLAAVQITLSENRGSIQATSMQWLVIGPTLKGHVLSAALKDASDPSVVRLDLPLATADRPEISQGATSTREGVNFGGIHDLLVAGRGIVELQTDMPSRPTVTIVLVANRIGDWVRPYCS